MYYNAITHFQNKDYLFYHDGALADSGNHRISVCVDELFYYQDGTIRMVVMTREGIEKWKDLG